MKRYNIFRLISIIAYCFIMLNGEMISLPFIFYLFFSLFDKWTLTQLFSLAAFAGLTILIGIARRKRGKTTIALEMAAFLLLIAPIIDRLTSVPIRLFAYWTFVLPTTIFIVFFILSIFLATKQNIEQRPLSTIT